MTTPRRTAPTITVDATAVWPIGLSLVRPDNPTITTRELRKSRDELRKRGEEIRKIRTEILEAQQQLILRVEELARGGHIHGLDSAEAQNFNSVILENEQLGKRLDGVNEQQDRLESDMMSHDELEMQYSESMFTYQGQGSASYTTSTDRTFAKKMFEIPGRISDQTSSKEHWIAAMGDTAAKYNFMKEDYAIRKGFAVRREHVRRVAITRDHDVTTTGTVEVDFRFGGEKERYSLIFYLLPECIEDVILGKRFLKLTETFSVLKNFTRRVKKHLHDGLSKLHLLYLGDSAPKFTGLLNGRPREALADSGSNALIMDEDFARKMGLPIRNDPSHRNTVYFADKTVARTCGMTYNVRWQFGLGGSDTEHMLDFHILKNAPADVILSDEFLFKTSAFSEYDCYLVDEDDEDEDADAYFYGIKIDTSYNNVSGQSPLHLTVH